MCLLTGLTSMWWTMKIRKGDRFRVVRDTSATGAIHWSAAFTSDFHCVIPAGTVLVARQNRGPGLLPLGFMCAPEDYAVFEERFVPSRDRLAIKYAGYSFTFNRWAVGRELEPLS